MGRAFCIPSFSIPSFSVPSVLEKKTDFSIGYRHKILQFYLILVKSLFALMARKLVFKLCGAVPGRIFEVDGVGRLSGDCTQGVL